MRLYIGTSEERGHSILVEGLIRCQVDRIYEEEDFGEFETTDGYVYLTNDVTMAAYYGNKAQIISESAGAYLYLFEVEIDEGELLPDLDELKVEATFRPELHNKAADFSVAYSINELASVRIDRDLSVDRDVVRYAKLPCTINFEDPMLEITKRCISSRKSRQPEVKFELIQLIPWILI
ncbi:hypothetical protein M5X06_21975 [Paenibacillus alvei]|uniref:Uncharacterized protein n=1 Tax=Paenibacillus alvei TaxID=44250 RepID=A0ABT4H2P7_PAEAL|nr:hypothetical protein [Paenibacillus alvei]MCY9763253.1 hypothetical protein [Paenibacillus alvei]MCY9769458.1 hypothetical protein [Paenibacillus alvei]